MKSSFPPGIHLDFTVMKHLGLPRRARGVLDKAASATFSHLPKNLQGAYEVPVLIGTNAAVEALNHDFRGVKKPTNVLSFPQFEPAQLKPLKMDAGLHYLGDIAIAYPYVVDEAKRTHKLLINHLRHLMIHGLLHLFGYDHTKDAQAKRMESLETKIMASLGCPDPYLAPQPKTRSRSLKIVKAAQKQKMAK